MKSFNFCPAARARSWRVSMYSAVFWDNVERDPLEFELVEITRLKRGRRRDFERHRSQIGCGDEGKRCGQGDRMDG